MASSASTNDGTAADLGFAKTENLAKVICEFIRGIMKIGKLKTNEHVVPVIEGLGQYVEELVGTKEGRQILCNMRKLASRIKNKENFLAMIWRIFHTAGRICSGAFGRLGLIIMGTALLVFLLSTATRLGEGVLAVWFTLAARTFALQLFTRGSNLMREGVKETIPNKKAFVSLLNTIACGSGQEQDQVSREEICQLESRVAQMCPDHDWVLL